MGSLDEEAEKVLDLIKEKELVDLAITMGNIQSPTGYEKYMTEFCMNWLGTNGFKAIEQTISEGRSNAIGILKGAGRGYSLLFNSHMDSEQGSVEEVLRSGMVKASPPVAWVDGTRIFGKQVQNDRGPMACFLVAAKAIKEAGITLKGDLILTMVVGEIGSGSIDEFQGPRYAGKGLGSRHAVTHGIVADYALVAETTDFGVTWVETGAGYYKITLEGVGLYTPRSYRPELIEEHPNAIVKMAKLIQALEDWGRDYEKRYTYISPAGKVVPKVNIGAIRGGRPYNPSRTCKECSIYLDVRIPAPVDPLTVQEELAEVIKRQGLGGEIDPYMIRKGYEGKNMERLVESITEAHRRIRGNDPPPVSTAETSMWRDVNVFNEVGIPALTFGPRRLSDRKKAKSPGLDSGYMETEDLVNTARMYALVALDICRTDKRG